MKRVVQRTPSVGLQIPLARVPAPVASALPTPAPELGGSECDVESVSWVNASILTNSSAPADIVTPDPSDPSLWHVRQAWYQYDKPGWSITILGMAYGPSVSGVSWQWSWNGSTKRVFEIRAVGPMLIANFDRLNTTDILYYDRTLTARAFCGGAEVGVLRLRVFSG